MGALQQAVEAQSPTSPSPLPRAMQLVTNICTLMRALPHLDHFTLLAARSLLLAHAHLLPFTPSHTSLQQRSTQAAVEMEDWPCMYLAHLELERSYDVTGFTIFCCQSDSRSLAISLHPNKRNILPECLPCQEKPATAGMVACSTDAHAASGVEYH